MNITVLIKTFRRPEACQRLIDSIEKYYPKLPIIVLDDSTDDCEFGFDIGLSRGRNELVNKCQTKYCIILDDDCIFTPNTNLYKMVSDLEDRDLDILQFRVPGLDYNGLFETNGTEVRYRRGDNNGLYDFCGNIFLAKTNSLKNCKWDEDLKMGEHFAYFYEHRGKLRIGVSVSSEVEHHHIDTPGYAEYRYRAMDYVRQYMRKKGITKRIDGNEVIVC